MSKLIKKTFHELKRFKKTLNSLMVFVTYDGAEFQKSYKGICPKELVLKLERSGSQTTFLDLKITISNGKMSTKLKNVMKFLSVLFTSQIFIPLSLSYGTVMSEIFHIIGSSFSIIY